MTFDELKQFLMEAEYTDKQWREVRAIGDIRMGSFSSKEASLKDLGEVGQEYTNLLYDQLKNYLATQCKIAAPPLSILRKSKPTVYKAVVDAANFLYAISEEWNPDHVLRRNFVVSVYYLYSKLVVQYLRDCRVPVSVKTALQHTDKFVGLVDKAYPDYVKNGMIKMVILGPSKANQLGYSQ